MLFVVKTTDSLQLYADFSDFLEALTLELDGVNRARSMFARGPLQRGYQCIYRVQDFRVYPGAVTKVS